VSCLLVIGDEDGVTYPVVWPSATESLADTIGVQLPSGDRATEGDIISGGGGYLYVADEYGIPAECRPATGEVAVFNPTEPVEVNTAAGG
jgi:hypothetical protein